MSRFLAPAPQHMVAFDASLWGIGIVWKRIEPNGALVDIGCCAVTHASFCFGKDSSFQNVSEFLAVILGLIGIRVMGLQDSVVKIRGDSRSALAWAEKARFRGHINTNAALVYVLTCAELDIRVSEPTEFLKGILNTQCDNLSRGKYDASLEGVPRIDLFKFPEVRTLFELCKPAGTGKEVENTYTSTWRETRRALSSLWSKLGIEGAGGRA